MSTILNNECFWGDGPQPGKLHEFPGVSSVVLPAVTPLKQTLTPVVTGTSILGVKFNKGVVIACDTLGSYGSMARFTRLSRILRVNDTTVMAAGGDFADFQFIKSVIEQRVINDDCIDDDFKYTPLSLHSWLTRVYYNRRSRFNPLWNTIVVGGMQNGKPYLGYVDKIGTAYEANSVASGYGAYIAQPLLRDALEKNPNLSEADAKNIIARCMSVLFYRDARSWNKYEIAVIAEDGKAVVEGPIIAKSNWDIAKSVRGYE